MAKKSNNNRPRPPRITAQAIQRGTADTLIRFLSHTICTLDEWLKPLFIIDSAEHITFFKWKVYRCLNLDNLKTLTRQEMDENALRNIYYGFENLLMPDLKRNIHDLELGISELSRQELNDVERKIITLLGIFKFRIREYEPKPDHTYINRYFVNLLKTNEKGLGISLHDYHDFIVVYEQYLVLILDNRFKAILDTITVLKEAGGVNSDYHDSDGVLGSKKISAKFYALLHWILIELGKESDFERDDNGRYKRSIIQTFARNRYRDASAQQFYREFRSLDITNRMLISNTFGKGYKEIISGISKNDRDVVQYLKDWPN